MKKSVTLFALCFWHAHAYIARRRAKAFASGPLKVLSSETIATMTNSENNTETVLLQCSHARQRKRWGVDNEHEDEYWNNDYWFDERIHTLGNVGFFGAVHAAVAGVSTKLIDVFAYNGIDMRHRLARDLSNEIQKENVRVLDLCCGVGISTRALRDAFPNAEAVIGVDTSPEMVAMAEFLTDHTKHLTIDIPRFFNVDYVKFATMITLLKEQKNWLMYGSNRAIKYLTRNAEDTALPSSSFDLVTVMYAFHEVPKHGREKILTEAQRLLHPGGTLAVVDICTDYRPPDSMLSGEPYVLEYQQNIHQQLQEFKGIQFSEYRNVLPGQVGMWIGKRS